MIVNPFHTTKATYYEDPDIVKFWVSPEDGNNFFETVMMPQENMPIRILGGKGSGKTHILRYFSFNAQKLRALDKGSTILDEIHETKYIGVYTVASGLHVNRFSGRDIDNEIWKNIFYYYINLELLERILKKVQEVLNVVKYKYEGNLDELKDLFFDDLDIQDDQFLIAIYNKVRQERKDIDKKIARLSMPGNEQKLQIDPIFNIEDNFFPIVKTIFSNISYLQGIKVLYIIDEFENYSLEQQKFFNTLIRQPKFPETIGFRLSGRLYAKKTAYTLDDKEILQENAEIKTIYLEQVISKNFPAFAQKLYKTRIEKNTLIDVSSIDFETSFEESKVCNKKILINIMSKHQDKEEKKHFTTLRKALDKHSQKLTPDEIESIVNNLACNENWFLEKINIWLLFQSWNKNIIVESSRIKESCQVYLDGNTSQHNNAIEKYGGDMLYQLFRTYRRSVSLSGYKNIVYMAKGNPRIFLSILNNIFAECISTKVSMLSSEIVECKIQDNALLESSKWFWNNFSEDIKDSRTEWAIIKLCEFFRKVRRTDKPSEKSLVTFTYSSLDVDDEINDLITLAVHHSLLLELEPRAGDRNSGEMVRKLRIHPMLAPKWELPLKSGGDTPFSKAEITALFSNNEKEWEKLSEAKLVTKNILPSTPTATLF